MRGRPSLGCASRQGHPYDDLITEPQLTIGPLLKRAARPRWPKEAAPTPDGSRYFADLFEPVGAELDGLADTADDERGQGQPAGLGCVGFAAALSDEGGKRARESAARMAGWRWR